MPVFGNNDTSSSSLSGTLAIIKLIQVSGDDQGKRRKLGINRYNGS
jgi:hypothetical protein